MPGSAFSSTGILTAWISWIHALGSPLDPFSPCCTEGFHPSLWQLHIHTIPSSPFLLSYFQENKYLFFVPLVFIPLHTNLTESHIPCSSCAFAPCIPSLWQGAAPGGHRGTRALLAANPEQGQLVCDVCRDFLRERSAPPKKIPLVIRSPMASFTPVLSPLPHGEMPKKAALSGSSVPRHSELSLGPAPAFCRGSFVSSPAVGFIRLGSCLQCAP